MSEQVSEVGEREGGRRQGKKMNRAHRGADMKIIERRIEYVRFKQYNKQRF